MGIGFGMALWAISGAREHKPLLEDAKATGRDSWLTIEAIGRGRPKLASTTRVWRDFAESPKACYRDGHRGIRDGRDTA